MTELFLYGEITSEKYFDEDESAKSFVDKLNDADDDELILHVNSMGGDVFAALAIFNAIKNFKGTVTAKVDGIAASAASLVVCAANKVVMASNALMMIHLPATFLSGFYTSTDLSKARDALAATEDAIIDTYQQRINRAQSSIGEKVDVRTMLQNETWFNAADAVKWGFADEIAEPVDAVIDGNFLIVNSLKVDMKKFDESKIRRAMEVTMQAEKISDIRAQEIGRIRSLMKLRGTNSVVDALIDVAIDKGQTVDEIQPFLDAVSKVEPAQKSTPVDEISAVIRDQMNSGAENVRGGQSFDKMTAQQQMIINAAKGGKSK